MPVWTLRTTRHVLRGAARHLVRRSDTTLVWITDLSPGDLVDTENGPEVVVSVDGPGDAEPMYDFQVDSPDHLYYSSGVLSHNSTSLGARQLISAHIMPGYRSLYIVPHEEHRKTYANRLREMERAFHYKTVSPHHRQNLNYKEYPNGSIIELIRVWTSADEARGKTCDALLLDEFQHFDINLWPEVEQTQKVSDIPTTIYAGTSLTVETALETKWLQSSQGVWMLRGPRGWLNTGDRETTISMIKRHGLCCPHTGRLLDVRDGEYVHADQQALNNGFVGLHIPQIIIPDMVESPIEWEKIWRSFVDYDIKKFLQEVLGIPTMEGVREVTVEDLKGMCILPDTEAEAINKSLNRN